MDSAVIADYGSDRGENGSEHPAAEISNDLLFHRQEKRETVGSETQLPRAQGPEAQCIRRTPPRPTTPRADPTPLRRPAIDKRSDNQAPSRLFSLAIRLYLEPVAE